MGHVVASDNELPIDSQKVLARASDFVTVDKQFSQEDAQAFFEVIGFEKARALRDEGNVTSTINRLYLREWVSVQERKRAEQERQDEIGRANAALAATQQSAQASQDAARWAMWAAVGSVIASVVALAIALYKGELPAPF